MTFDLKQLLRNAHEQEQMMRWEMAMTSICPVCVNNRVVEHIEIEKEEEITKSGPCFFCHSRAELSESYNS